MTIFHPSFKQWCQQLSQDASQGYVKMVSFCASGNKIKSQLENTVR